MPADTYSSILGTLVMGTGNDNNTWGDNCNDDVFAIMEDGIAGHTSTSTTGGTIDLSTSPPPAGPSAARHAILEYTGTLSSDLTILVPDNPKTWVVINRCTVGAFGFYMQSTSGGSSQRIFIPGGGIPCIVVSTGDGSLRRVGRRTGEIFAHGGTSVPADALECNGSAISRTGIGRELFVEIGTTWGSGNGSTTFNLPDFYTAGRFLRSRKSGSSVGDLQSDGIASHTHTGSVSSTGTASGTTGTESADHTHTFSGTTTGQSVDHTHVQSSATLYGDANAAIQNAAGSNMNSNSHSTEGTSNDHTHDYSGTTSGKSATHTHSFSGSVSTTGSFTTNANSGAISETRPINATVLMCIRL